MMKELQKLWEMGYEFTEGSYYGDSKVEEFEDVVDTLEEVEAEEYLTLEVEVDHEAKTVYLFIQDDE